MRKRLKTIRNWLIHKLGGYTPEDYDNKSVHTFIYTNSHIVTLKDEAIVEEDGYTDEIGINAYLRDRTIRGLAVQIIAENLVKFETFEPDIPEGALKQRGMRASIKIVKEET